MGPYGTEGCFGLMKEVALVAPLGSGIDIGIVLAPVPSAQLADSSSSSLLSEPPLLGQVITALIAAEEALERGPWCNASPPGNPGPKKAPRASPAKAHGI